MGPWRGDLVENEWKPLEDWRTGGLADGWDGALRMTRCKVSCPPPSSITGTQAARPTAPFAAGTGTGTGDRPGVDGFPLEMHQARCMALAESGEATSPGSGVR